MSWELVGTSLSEPHTSVTALRTCVYVCLSVCLWPYTENVKLALLNFIITKIELHVHGVWSLSVTHIMNETRPSPFFTVFHFVYYTECKLKNKKGEAWERGYILSLLLMHIFVLHVHTPYTVFTHAYACILIHTCVWLHTHAYRVSVWAYTTNRNSLHRYKTFSLLCVVKPASFCTLCYALLAALIFEILHWI